jgi:hypothetical protein
VAADQRRQHCDYFVYHYLFCPYLSSLSSGTAGRSVEKVFNFSGTKAWQPCVVASFYFADSAIAVERMPSPQATCPCSGTASKEPDSSDKAERSCRSSIFGCAELRSHRPADRNSVAIAVPVASSQRQTFHSNCVGNELISLGPGHFCFFADALSRAPFFGFARLKRTSLPQDRQVYNRGVRGFSGRRPRM